MRRLWCAWRRHSLSRTYAAHFDEAQHRTVMDEYLGYHCHECKRYV